VADVALLGKLTDNLIAETRVLTEMVEGLGSSELDLPTPAPGWSVRDHLSHLAYFDDVATMALLDPEGFATLRAASVEDVDGVTERVAREHHGLDGFELLAWLDAARTTMVAAYSAADPTTRVPWFGPDMSVASAVTARIMETWAHGQDVADALGREHRATPALRDVAHLGVRTRAFAFAQRGLPAPAGDVRVELVGLGGEPWSWGPEGASDRVAGSAVDFCLVVTRRCHPDDTELRIDGPGAQAWMQIAQAFAGPPGADRPPRSSAPRGS
jgi:uncharacterized protein (TIGR03084 family)